MEIKSWSKNIVVHMVKIGFGHSGVSTLKLAVSQKGINRITAFWCVDKNSGMSKVDLIIFRWWWSKMDTVF